MDQEDLKVYKRLRKSKLRYSELYHWGFKKDHKYIAKVPIGKGKYRYFYDKEEYNNYLKNKTVLNGNSSLNSNASFKLSGSIKVGSNFITDAIDSVFGKKISNVEKKQ